MKISVITVCFNAGPSLEKTITSVISQDYHDVEYIIIDGGSTDGTLEIIRKNEKKIAFCISEPDGGIYNAMNKGIKKATGEWLIFMNGGDCFINEHVITKISPVLQDSELQVVYGNIIKCYKNHKERVYPLRMKNPDIVDFVLCGIDHQAAFIRKKLFDKYGLYDEQYKLAADSIFFMRTLGVYREKCRYTNLDVAYFMSGGSSFTHASTYQSEKNAAFEKELSPFTEYIFELAEYRKSTTIRYMLRFRLYLKNAGIGRIVKRLLHWRFF